VQSTLSSSGGQVVAELAPTVSAGTAARRPRAAMFIGAGLAIAAIGALVMFFALRSDSRTSASKQVAQETVPETDKIAAPKIESESPKLDTAGPKVDSAGPQGAKTETAQLDASGDAKQLDASGDAKPSAATKTGTKAADGKSSKKTGLASVGSSTATASANADSDSDGDATAKQKLQDADASLKASDWGRAEQLANAVINSEDATPKQKARAAMLHGIAQCLGRNNEEVALMDLRRLRGSPALRAKLLKTCQQGGFLLGER
jgi:hypothetical protein